MVSFSISIVLVSALSVIFLILLYFAYLGLKETSGMSRLAGLYQKYPLFRVIYVIPIIGPAIHEILEAVDIASTEGISAGITSIKSLWGFKDGDRVVIICPELDHDPKLEEFLYFRKYGDIDAFVWTIVSLSKTFTNLEIEYYTSEEFKNTSERQMIDHTVVIGGPDFNSIAASLMNDIPYSYTTTEDDEVALRDNVSGENYQSEFSTDGHNELITDHGFFAKIPNPNNPNREVIMISGLHTHGVYGTALAFLSHHFSGGGQTATNCQRIIERFGEDPHFAITVEVNVIDKQTRTPKIDPDDAIRM